MGDGFRSVGHSQQGWQADVTVSDSIPLPPEPHLVDSIGRNYRLESAVADLVDNSIDAKATKVLIRFVINNNRVASFYVVDDGCGIADTRIDSAMTFGGVRTYGSSDLGHFGLGMKAASFSQADSFTVVSRAEGSAPVGRRWLATTARDSFNCDVVQKDFCLHELERAWNYLTPEHGTIVRWDMLRAVPPEDDPAATSRYVHDRTIRLQHHLGMIFHRFLEQGKVQIGIDVEDVSAAGFGPVVEVNAIDPFAYTRTGAAGYPKRLNSAIGQTPLTADCHVWPGRSQSTQFRLPGAPPEDFQGLYLYRRDRLLQAGGWNGLEVQSRDLQLARVSIDIADALVDMGTFQMNPEKTRVETGHEFAAAFRNAVADDGTTFQSYLESARLTFKQSNQRKRSRNPVVPLGRGVPPRVRRVVERELNFLQGRDEIDLRWRDFGDERFFDVDREANTVWLNSRYRPALTAGDKGTFNDAPLVKTLLFLLVENLFHGSHWGPKDKDNLELWQTLLTAAAQEQP